MQKIALAIVTVGCVLVASAETFTNGNLSVTFKSGWPVSISRDGKVVLARSPRVLNYEIQEDTNWVSKVKSPKRFEPPVQIVKG